MQRKIVSNAKQILFVLSLILVIVIAGSMHNQVYAGIYDAYTGIEDASATGNVITVTFERDVKAYASESELVGDNGLIYIGDWSGNRAHNFTSDDKIAFDGKKMTITMADDYEVKSGQMIWVKENALQTADGTVITNTGNKWTITVNPSIKSMEASKTVLDSKGGEVTVTMNGVNLDKTRNIKAVLRTSDNKDSGIDVAMKYGSTPTATFTLPENTSDKAVTYRLDVDSIDGTTVYHLDGLNITVLGKNQSEDETTVSDLTIDGQKSLDFHPTSDPSEKFTVRITGTNLDPKKVELRAIDENGVVWPVYHYTACSGTIRFHSTANGNGASGGGNIVYVELMVAKTLGVEHTYTIQASVSGKGDFDTLNVPGNPYDNAAADSFLSEPTATMHVYAGNQEECTADDVDNVKTVTVKYVDENGKEIADSETYKAYGVSMLNQFAIKAKDIDGYTLTDSPAEETLKSGFVRDLKDQDYTLTYKYKNNNPTKPDQDEKVKLANVVVSPKTYAYTGKTIVPKVKVYNENGNVVDASQYKVCCAVKSVGTHKISVEGQDKAEGRIDAKYTIVPSKVSGLKVKSAKKAAKVSWKKHKTQTTGFQIQYSTKKSFKSAKTVTVRKSSAAGKTIKSLKSRKTYYIRIRAYKKVSAKNYYSSWSSAKKVRVK